MMATIVHAALGYVFLTLIVRVLTRRPGAQMTLFEFVLVFLMGGVIILSTVGNDRSITNCTCAILTVALMHRATSYMKVRFPVLGTWLVGTPLVLVRDGKWKEDLMAGMNLAREDVLASSRLNGLRGPEEIQYAVLERNGGISIIEKEDDESADDSTKN